MQQPQPAIAGTKRKEPSPPQPAKRARPNDDGRRKAEALALRATVVEYVGLDDRIRQTLADLKAHKKRREELRTGIMEALRSAGMPACKLGGGAGASPSAPPVHLRLKTRKTRVKPKKPDAIAAMGSWLRAQGIASADAGEQLYKSVFEDPKAVVEKTSLCRIRPRQPKKAPKPKKPKPAPKVLMLNGDDEDDEDDDDGSSSCYSDDDSSSSASVSSDSDSDSDDGSSDSDE
ncbi:hypothetical protein QKT49_gp062 [Acanthamoeba castellanii medusavirus]|uniref:Uncharacterized protein n=1 Tax=Acanthamoeba castellanii medusavirus J1 TaxID=3114988 RepID=A0A3T1CWJ3_9VIRU|nr:hypothetical protein QKT49_gp062 [Acanthamoeba castellanii medusavirus]BBI30202.1 hypothetical protein [Acanthamoeba castellanii medusavirus J1]